MKNKSMTVKVKTDVWKLPNKMHLEVQQNNRVNVFKPKKGKGSYTRKGLRFDY